jgi:hypothetical protein
MADALVNGVAATADSGCRGVVCFTHNYTILPCHDRQWLGDGGWMSNMVSPDAADVASLALDIVTVAFLPTSLKIDSHALRQYAPDAGD